VDKNNVVKQLLEMYRKDKAISNNKSVVSFEGEQANGNGLLQELYSLLGIVLLSKLREATNTPHVFRPTCLRKTLLPLVVLLLT